MVYLSIAVKFFAIEQAVTEWFFYSVPYSINCSEPLTNLLANFSWRPEQVQNTKERDKKS